MSILDHTEHITDRKFVICCVCNKKTYDGIKQTRMYKLENEKMVSLNLYMCLKCFEKGEVWPGVDPTQIMKNTQIQRELDRFRDNSKVYK